MVDHVPASISIGGALPAAQYDTFCRLLMDAHLSVGWDDELFSPAFGIAADADGS